DERSVPLLEPDREPGAVRAAEARLRRPAQHVDVPQLGRRLLGDVCGPVGAVVVDDEDVRAREGGTCPPEELVDVLGLDVRRGDDERAHARQLTAYLLQRRYSS